MFPLADGVTEFGLLEEEDIDNVDVLVTDSGAFVALVLEAELVDETSEDPTNTMFFI